MAVVTRNDAASSKTINGSLANLVDAARNEGGTQFISLGPGALIGDCPRQLWSPCSKNGGTCHCNGTVRFGIDKAWSMLNTSAPIECVEDSFSIVTKEGTSGDQRSCECRAAKQPAFPAAVPSYKLTLQGSGIKSTFVGACGANLFFDFSKEPPKSTLTVQDLTISKTGIIVASGSKLVMSRVEFHHSIRRVEVVGPGSSAWLTDVIFRDNSNMFGGIGGALFIHDDALAVFLGTITCKRNHASLGGCVGITEGGVLEMRRGLDFLCQDNYAILDGGCIAVNSYDFPPYDESEIFLTPFLFKK